MYTYVYVYIYVFICTCMCICIFIYIRTQIYADLYVHVYIYYAHEHKFHQTSPKICFKMQYIQIKACLCLYTRVYVYINTGVCIINVCIHSFVFTHEDFIKRIVYILVWGGYE